MSLSWQNQPTILPKRRLLNDSALLLLLNTQTQVFWFFLEDSRRNIRSWWISIDCYCEGFKATPEGSWNRWDLLKKPQSLWGFFSAQSSFFPCQVRQFFFPQNRQILVALQGYFFKIFKKRVDFFWFFNTLFHHQLWDMKKKNRWCIYFAVNCLLDVRPSNAYYTENGMKNGLRITLKK